MTGYKGMTKDMTCREMQFEIGKTYHVDGEISLCKNGLHFCERLIDVMDYYDMNDDSRYFEIEADGVIKSNGKKSVASSLTITREISGIELYRTVYSDGYGYGYGYGCGDGYGYDYGYGCGDGNGYGDSYGDGHGYGYGYGCGYGDGDGNGYGYGYGNGYGYDYGYGKSNIQRIIKYV